MITLWYRKTGEVGYTEVSEANPLPTSGSGGGGGTTDGNLEITQLEIKQILDDGFNDTTPASVMVVSSEFETVAASQTDQMLGATGAAGDTLEGLLVIPSSTTVEAISIEYGSTNITVYAGGTVGADLKPFFIPLFGIAAPSGGWEITTGAGCSVIAFGNFT